MTFGRLIIGSAVLCCLAGGFAVAKHDSRSAGDLRKSGTIRLNVTCSANVKDDFQAAVALLHSFFYEEARRRFEAIAERDPGCAMAWWGVAMTRYHPLWSPPTAEELQLGIEAVEKARAIDGTTDLEKGLIDAIDAYFRTEDGPPTSDGPVAQSCHGPREHGARAGAFRDALQDLHDKHPKNLEVTVFYALSLLGTAPPTDKAYKQQLKATALLEPLFEQNPEHPGIAHYVIHAYDYPSLATRALVAARQYDDIAPWVPHALHMPTHIYTRLGMWRESIEGNVASSAAARDYAASRHDGATIMDDLHALDYLVFAYLQTAQDGNARKVLEHLRRIDRIVPGNEFVSAYSLGAIPARYVLERKRWKDAAKLEAVRPDFLAAYPFAMAHVEFARALGAARSGELAIAREAVGRLESLRKGLTEPRFLWWAGQIEIQETAARGWLRHGEGKDDDAVNLLQRAARLEEKSGTHPVTPGQILPAREQLADLLMELERPAEALKEYERSLQAFPNRLNSHFGAARAAELTGRKEIARKHYGEVVAMAQSGDGRRDELNLARQFQTR